MHMWMWFGYDLGEFLFPGLTISSRWSFALTWIALFFVALLYEGSKVYLARVQRAAIKRLYPYRSDERRNLLCDREQGNMEPTTSRNATSGQVGGRWESIRVRALVNAHQSFIFIVHNVVGYMLMLAVMIYNVHLLLAVVFGTMLGYFLFGTKLTRLQMQCFSTKRVVICTPECDDTAETTTPPLLDSPMNSESDLFICQTRTCIQPSHYFRASTSQDGTIQHATCYYGAKKCPSKVARAKRTETHCHHGESEKEDSPSVEDVQLLRTERQGCCKKKPEPPPEEKCCKKEITVVIHDPQCCEKDSNKEEVAEERRQEMREQSPPITCCQKSKTSSESQEQIVK